jgi:hypothetical protein
MAVARTFLICSTYEVSAPAVSCSPQQYDMHTDEGYWVVFWYLAVERQGQRLDDTAVSLVQGQ